MLRPRHQDSKRNIVSELTGHKKRNKVPPKMRKNNPAEPNSAAIIEIR